LRKVIQVKTLEEAKKIIYEMVVEGINYREISKTKFRINNKIRKFSISQISSFKKEIEDKASATNAKSKSNLDKNSQIVQIFRDLKKKVPIVDIVIKTGFDIEVIKETVKAYEEFERYLLVRKEVIEFLFAELSSVFPCKNDEDLMAAASSAADAFYLLHSHPYTCGYCGKPEIPGKNELKWLQKQLSHSKWGHLECLKKNGDSINQFL